MHVGVWQGGPVVWQGAHGAPGVWQGHMAVPFQPRPLPPPPPPPPAPEAPEDAVVAYPRERIFCFDVECVAVGRTHELSSRAPCSVALVDSFGEVLFGTKIQPDRPVISYLTPITGLTEEDLRDAMPLDQAIQELKLRLPKEAVLIGQQPAGDIAWMGLQRGVDFAEVIDLSLIFRGYNRKYNNYVFHSLQHEAAVLLQKPHAENGSHDPAWDARASVELYELAREATDEQLREMRQQLIAARPPPSIAKRYGYKMDGVCMAKFMPKFCICGVPFN